MREGTAHQAGSVEHIRFEIDLNAPLALPANLGRDVYADPPRRWHILTIDVQRTGENQFHLTLHLDAGDIDPEAIVLDELRSFRDQIVALLALTALVPIRLLSMGLFTFPLGSRRYKQLSLGPMVKTASPVALPTVGTLVNGLELSAQHAAAVYFLWQALNAEESLYRFINLEIACELVIGVDSPAPRSRHLACANPRCKFELEQCPDCGRSWTIPTQLRERAAFLLTDADTLDAFTKARNTVFHGSPRMLDATFLAPLSELNLKLIIVLRNYLGGGRLGLSPVSPERISMAVNTPVISMSVYYQMPEPT